MFMLLLDGIIHNIYQLKYTKHDFDQITRMFDGFL